MKNRTRLQKVIEKYCCDAYPELPEYDLFDGEFDKLTRQYYNDVRDIYHETIKQFKISKTKKRSKEKI